jgi:hypothetical protein
VRAVKTVGLAFMSAGLAACYDELPNARLTNNSGHAIVVVEKAGADGARRIAIAHGVRSGRIVAYGTGRRFDILSEGCTYSYVFPAMGVNYAWRTADGSRPDYSSHFPVLAQVEPDFQIYLVPPGTTTALTAAQLARAQGHRFPLKPISKACS